MGRKRFTSNFEIAQKSNIMGKFFLDKKIVRKQFLIVWINRHASYYRSFWKSEHIHPGFL